MKITISRQFQDLIYPLTAEELAVLEQSILKQGVRDALVVWQNGKNYLIDGHHRYSIIQKYKIKQFKTITLQFSNKSEVVDWILENQLGRRNVTPEGISYLRGLRYKNEKQNHGGDRKSSSHNGDLKTSELLAQKYKVGNIKHSSDESSHRWTVDTTEDFALISKIIESLYPKNPEFSLEDVLSLMADNLSWQKINCHVKQKEVQNIES